MEPQDYDKKVSTTIRALREARGVKQSFVAYELGMSESYYSKYEHGCCAFTSSQIKLIGSLIGIPHLQLFAITDAYDNPAYRITPISKILVKFIQMFEGNLKSVGLTQEELDLLLEQTKVTESNPKC